MAGDILQALKESMKEQTTDRRNFENIAMLKRYFTYAVDLLDIVLNIQRDRRYRDYHW